MNKKLFFQTLVGSLLLGIVATAQTSVLFPPGQLASQEWVKTYVDSVLSKTPVVTTPTENTPTLKPCDEGPILQSITSIKDNSLSAQFHGKNVFGIDWHILDASGIVRMGSIEPTSSVLPLTFQSLPPGSYKLRLFGNTCQGKTEKEFVIEKTTGYVPPIPPANSRLDGTGTHELFMNLTGYGYSPTDPNGMNGEWVDRIEAFRYDWGWGITGIRLCVRWYEWEPSEGQYTRAGLQKVINYCRERGLKLSVFFWPWRKAGDPMLPNGHVMTGHRGKEHELEGDKRMGSLVSADVNQKLYTAIKEMSRELATYEGAYYMSVGTAAAEELINPVVGIGHSIRPEVTGFEEIFQKKFQEYLATKGRSYQRPNIHEWDYGVALDMGNETGKDFARFISLSLARYFENFTRAVKDGSDGKILSCYMYPDAGNPQNAWYLHANFAAQASSADAMYGTDGLNEWDNQRKLLCNAINLGMGKVSLVEWDAEDLGIPPTDRNCSPLNAGKVEREFGTAYGQGVQVIGFAMSYCVSQIRGLDAALKKLRSTYVGQPYHRPDWPTTPAPITPAFWKGQEIYAPYFQGNNFIRPDDSDFWGTGSKN